MRSYSASVYIIELTFIGKLNQCKWYQFAKKRKARAWREKQLMKFENQTKEK